MLKRYLFFIIAIFSISFCVSAQNEDNNAIEENEEDFYLSVTTPEVKGKDKQLVKDFMRTEALKLQKEKFEVELARDEEVIIAIISSDALFLPNETSLRENAKSILDKFSRFIVPAGQYKLLLKMHSDDTGSDDYLFDLTDERVSAVLDYLDKYGFNEDAVKGYPCGGSEPLYDNDSRDNRQKNRRLEIYIVPDKGIIDKIKHKK